MVLYWTELDGYFHHLNSINWNIRLTVEIENDNFQISIYKLKKNKYLVQAID